MRKRALIGALLTIVALGGLAVPAAPAEAAGTCTLNVGGKVGTYICDYGTTSFYYQGRYHVFLIGTDNAVWHIYETCVGCWTFSNWTSLGGDARSRVGMNISGGGQVLKIVVKGTYNGCWNRFFNYPSNPGRWTDWYDQPDNPTWYCPL